MLIIVSLRLSSAVQECIKKKKKDVFLQRPIAQWPLLHVPILCAPIFRCSLYPGAAPTAKGLIQLLPVLRGGGEDVLRIQVT